MRRFLRTGIAAAVMMILFAPPAVYAAQTKSKPKPKQASKTNHAALGTTQLKGSEPKFGETWTLGKSNPINVTLNSAEYSCSHFQAGDRTYWPKAKEKFLVLHYTVHNPQPREALMRYDRIRFTVVDSNSSNWQGRGWLADDKDLKDINMMMKPGQKLFVRTAIAVPASGEMPKLMMQGSDQLVLRYDLKGKVKALPSPFADPNDQTGATALEEVAAQPGVYYPLGPWNVKFEGVSTTDDTIKDSRLPKGCRWMVISMSAKNITKQKQHLRYDRFNYKLVDQDGMEVKHQMWMYASSRWASVNTDIEPGQEMGFRYLFPIDADQKPKSFRIKQGGDDRDYVYDVSSFE